MSPGRVLFFLSQSIALGVIPIACHRHVPVERQTEVHREVRDSTKVVTIRDTATRDTSVPVFFRDTAPSIAFHSEGRTFNLQTVTERESLRAAIRKERELWRSRKPRDYRYLLRVGCFCPGPRGWLLMEVRTGQPLRAWDKTGRAASLTDWNTLSIDDLYENLEKWSDRNAEVQIAFDPRWHFPSYVRTSMRVPDAWSITEARALRPLR
jgi:hypothetical protein